MYERTLSTEVQFLKGVGPKLAVGLNKAGIATVKDVLWRLPRRYEDRTDLPPISGLTPGQWATIRGSIKRIESKSLRKNSSITRATVNDGTGSIKLTWFNQPWVKAQLEKGPGEIFAYGQIKEGGEIASPEWEWVSPDDESSEFGRIVPVYPLTEGLSQRTIRRAVRSAISGGYLDLLQDPLPKPLKDRHGLPDLKWALTEIHSPSDEPSRLEARRRLVFEEFFYLQLGLAMKRAATHQETGISFPVTRLLAGHAAPKLAPVGGTLFDHGEEEPAKLWDEIGKLLPFELTAAQRRVVHEIWRDMESPHPMNRLLQGDVGSGKTAVALCAMLAAVRSGYQAALMAPTEILAEQHVATIQRMLEPLNIKVGTLLGKQGAKDRRQQLQDVVSGAAQIVVGTHALIQESVGFARLGLVVVDEQHRFGVLQRKALRDKGVANPDVLVVTATPIPRTLTMTLYGDLDYSVIDELPPGRRAIKTHWKRPNERPAVYETVQGLVNEGRQAYFVCPMVSESENAMALAAQALYETLAAGPFSNFRLGLLHGQMRPAEKEDAMEAFRRHELDVLVSTTVIEVGVDVPNASVMVIEDANRFGLSQLHQLRGRVGRGSAQSYCILIADGSEPNARAKMNAMVGTTDGFVIAKEDLRLRGPGLMAGTQQSGHADFKVGDLVLDGKMMEVARQAAIETVEKDSALEDPMWNPVLENVRSLKNLASVITVS